MRTLKQTIVAGVLSIALSQAMGTASAYAQGPGSLGGYGASMAESGSGMGMNGPVIPYNGKFGGFMPYRMSGGSGSLSFQTRGDSAIGSNRTSFSLSTMSSGM